MGDRMMMDDHKNLLKPDTYSFGSIAALLMRRPIRCST